MPVPDTQAAALHAFLAGEADAHQRLHTQLIDTDEIKGYTRFTHAAFVIAARRRFSPTWTRAEVIKYVADVRATLADADSDQIDARAAENLIRGAVGDDTVDEPDLESAVPARLLLLTALIADEQLDETGLNDFVCTVRRLANQWWPNDL